MIPHPSRPQTPWSPEANRIDRPRSPAFINAVLAATMNSSDDCWASSLPYETECTYGGSASSVISATHARSE
eukprot:1846379-Pleurochrysis_carterae.AAC.1